MRHIAIIGSLLTFMACPDGTKRPIEPGQAPVSSALITDDQYLLIAADHNAWLLLNEKPWPLKLRFH